MRTLIVDFFYVSFPSLYKQCLAQKILNAVHPEECDFTFFFVHVPSSIEGGQYQLMSSHQGANMA